MMGKVLKELVDTQREIAALEGKRLLVSDEVLAADLLVYFGACPTCGVRLDFEPRVVAALAESRKKFIRLYGKALTLHYGDHPQCQEAVQRYIRQKPYERVTGQMVWLRMSLDVPHRRPDLPNDLPSNFSQP
jgi:hypothetical protein